jgi:hypothetical protein
MGIRKSITFDNLTLQYVSNLSKLIAVRDFTNSRLMLNKIKIPLEKNNKVILENTDIVCGCKYG